MIIWPFSTQSLELLIIFDNSHHFTTPVVTQQHLVSSLQLFFQTGI